VKNYILERKFQKNKFLKCISFCNSIIDFHNHWTNRARDNKILNFNATTSLKISMNWEFLIWFNLLYKCINDTQYTKYISLQIRNTNDKLNIEQNLHCKNAIIM